MIETFESWDELGDQVFQYNDVVLKYNIGRLKAGVLIKHLVVDWEAMVLQSVDTDGELLIEVDIKVVPDEA
jgi:hypothetical protein